MTEGNMSVYKYKAFKSGSKVSRLIIFLHGYNSCIEDVEPFAEMLLQHLDNTLVVMPEADTQSAVSYTHLDVYKRQHQRAINGQIYMGHLLDLGYHQLSFPYGSRHIC